MEMIFAKPDTEQRQARFAHPPLQRLIAEWGTGGLILLPAPSSAAVTGSMMCTLAHLRQI
jgi:hypothetical protein